MPMLRRMMELGCSLIDYEKMTDEAGRRLVFFGRFAGIAGMVDTLAGLGSGWKRRDCRRRSAACDWLTSTAGWTWPRQRWPRSAVTSWSRACPPSCRRSSSASPGTGTWPRARGDAGCAGRDRGRTGRPAGPRRQGRPARRFTASCSARSTVEPKEIGHRFDLKEYFSRPIVRLAVRRHLPHLSVLTNCIYWDARYPRLVTKQWLKQAFTDRPQAEAGGDRRHLL